MFPPIHLLATMAGSPIRAPLQNLLIPQSGEKSPIMTGSTARSSSPLLGGMSVSSPNYPRYPERSFCAGNPRSGSPQLPAKKRCMDPQQQLDQQHNKANVPEKEEDFTGPSQHAHDCSSDSPHTSAGSFSPKGVSSFDGLIGAFGTGSKWRQVIAAFKF